MICRPCCKAVVVAVAVRVVEVAFVFVALLHAPFAVSIWKYMFCGGGAVGEYVEVAVNAKVGIESLVVFPASGVIAVFNGNALDGAGVITVTVLLG